MEDVNLIPKEYKGGKRIAGAIFSKTGGIILALLILSLLLYGGLLFYSQQRNNVLADINQQIKDLNSQRDNNAEDAMIKTDEKINLSESIFKSHPYWSQLFSKIEALTLPQVYFSETKINFLNNKINIVFSGRAATYTALAQQMVSFKEEANTDSVNVSGIKLNEEGKIEFYLNIVFSQKLFKIQYNENE